MNRKLPQHKVDQLRSEMAPEQLQEFDEFCRFNRNCSEIRRLLEDWGYQISQTAVQAWYKANYPVGEEAKRLNAELLRYDGVDLQPVLQMSLARATNLFTAVMDQVDCDRFLMSEDLKADKLIGILPQLLREIRACSDSINGFQVVRDRKALEVAGAYRLAQELELTFRDSSFESALGEAIRGALIRIESSG